MGYCRRRRSRRHPVILEGDEGLQSCKPYWVQSCPQARSPRQCCQRLCTLAACPDSQLKRQMRAQVEAVVHAVAEATTAQPGAGAAGGGSGARGADGAAPKWNRPSALAVGGRGPRWPLRVGACLHISLQKIPACLTCSCGMGWDEEGNPGSRNSTC